MAISLKVGHPWAYYCARGGTTLEVVRGVTFTHCAMGLNIRSPPCYVTICGIFTLSDAVVWKAMANYS